MAVRVAAFRPAWGVALVAILISFTWVASRTAPVVEGPTTAGAVGRTGFAYLSGVRTFAAAVIWNRIDPIFHEYYDGVDLSEQTYMVPSMYLVTWLDPEFTQAYYVSSWIVSKRVGTAAGIELAREGLAKNPDSGLMHLNLAQLLLLEDRELHAQESARLAEQMFTGELRWTDDEERFEGIAVARDVYLATGRLERADQAGELLEHLRESGIGLGDHDHDGDGEQDH
jgi:hypothetical protein